MTKSTTLYDRVRAAYGLDEDDVDPYDSGVVHSPRRSPSMLPQLTEHLKEPKINSIHVPFDPEDQSDDEVVITSIYKRDTKGGKDGGPGKGDEKLGNGPDLASPKKTLSPEAAAFQPAALPLVEVYSAKGLGSPDAKHGKKYPGQRVPFCPWLIVKNYHSWFVGKQNSARIGPYFEKEALFRWQAWDFCYLWHPTKDKESTYALVVPTSQFQHFLDRINQTLKIQLTVPPGTNGDKFAVIFGQMKTPIPRFLGRAPNALAFDALTQTVPPVDPKDAIFEKPKMKAQAQEMFVKKVNGLFCQYGKGAEKKNKSEKTRKKRLLDRRNWGQQIKRAQRYMGIREKIDTVPFRSDAPRYIMQSLDYFFLPPYTQENDVVFVAMDIESYEFNHSAITEIGFGILDTRHLAGVPPGLACQNWLALIRGRHLRITEHATMINRVHVQGCENNFNFGTSEFVGIKDILAAVTQILQPRLPNGEPRHVVLVGHDIKSDISLVKNIGFHMTNDMFLDIIDTQYFHQHLRMRNQQAGLKAVLTELEIEHYFLHNGGNDAVYTLQAMVRIVVEKREASLRRQSERLRPGYTPDAEVLEAGWESGGELSDGSPLKAGTWGFYYATDNNGTPCASPSTSAAESPQKLLSGNTGSPAGMAGKAGSHLATSEQEDLIML